MVRLDQIGRVHVLKIMVMSKVWFMATYTHMPKKVEKFLDRLALVFIHRGTIPVGMEYGIDLRTSPAWVPPALSGVDIHRPVSSGGLNWWRVADQVQALQAKWIAELVKPDALGTYGIARWSFMPTYFVTADTAVQGNKMRGLSALIDGVSIPEIKGSHDLSRRAAASLCYTL